MKAITYQRYGGPEELQLRDVPMPQVRDDEVLVRVKAASLNPRDWHFMRGLPYFLRATYGLRGPKHGGLGSDIAGTVEAAGKDVTRFQPGDEVYADVLMGGLAQYVSVPAELVAPMPANLTFEQAAAVPLAALTTLQGLRDAAALSAGQRLLIIGAAGGVGTFAVQLGKWMGAHVTGVCSSEKAELVYSLGADEVIDYTRQDFADGSRTYDVVFQLAGTRGPWECRRALSPNGTLLVSSGESSGRWIGPVDRIIKAMLLSPFVSQAFRPFEAKRRAADLLICKELIEAGTLIPVIGRTYPLEELREAMTYLEAGHARGKVVVTIS